MSKLSQVRQALEANPRVKIVKVEENNYLPGKAGYWSHTVNFRVAPADGNLSAQGLKEFTMSLITDLEPTTVDTYACGEGALDMHGMLYFDEQIGTESVRHEIVITDADLLLSTEEDFVDGKLIIQSSDEALKRRVWVTTYPNIIYAEQRSR